MNLWWGFNKCLLSCGELRLVTKISDGKSARRQKSGFTTHSWIELAAGVCRYESGKCSELLHCPSLGRNLSDLRLACQKSDS